MWTAKVIVTVVATQKDYRLQGVRLMVIQPINADGSKAGNPIFAGDNIGSGVGETVIFAKSKEGAFAMPDQLCCCDAGICAIVDSVYTLENGFRRIEGC